MTPSTTLGIFVLLPAIAHQSTLDSIWARVQQIHNIPSLLEELSSEADRAFITVGILSVVYKYSSDVERFLQTHRDYAMEFGPFAWQTAYLAERYLSREILGGSFYLEPEDNERLVTAVAKFEEWLEDMYRRGIISFDPGNKPPVYIGPGDDPSTEDLRGVMRLLRNLPADVPEDPIVGLELYVLGFLPARVLGMLGVLATNRITPAEELPDTIEHYIGTMRTSGAIFRLSFRDPEKMRYEDTDRALVVDHIQHTFATMREAWKKGEISADDWKPIAAALKRILKWKREREHEEL